MVLRPVVAELNSLGYYPEDKVRRYLVNALYFFKLD